jgi:hypothetical protein
MRYYRHRQFGWVIVGTIVPVILLLVILGLPTARFSAELAVPFALLTSVLFLFGAMTVTVDQKHVALWFGVGVIRKRIALNEIRSYRCVRNPWYYSWGIHLVPGGTLYNVSGLSAVDVLLASGKHVRIGTNEPQALHAALRQVLGERPPLSVPEVEEEDRRARSVVLTVATVGVVVPLAIGVLFYFLMQPPSVKVSQERFLVRSALYGEEIPMTEVAGVSIVEVLPAIRLRTNGFALRGSLRGHFRLDEIGDGQLFIEAGTPPYVVVRTRRDFVIVNFKDPARTRNLYADLARNVDQK